MLGNATESNGVASVVPLLERVQGHALLQQGDLWGARDALEASLAAAKERNDLFEATLTMLSLIELDRLEGVEPPHRDGDREPLAAREPQDPRRSAGAAPRAVGRPKAKRPRRAASHYRSFARLLRQPYVAVALVDYLRPVDESRLQFRCPKQSVLRDAHLRLRARRRNGRRAVPVKGGSGVLMHQRAPCPDRRSDMPARDVVAATRIASRIRNTCGFAIAPGNARLLSRRRGHVNGADRRPERSMYSIDGC